MEVTPEQRQAWAASTRVSPFNLWMRERVNFADGTLNLVALHDLAREYGIDPEQYQHLNPGQQRMNIGNRLRRLVALGDGPSASIVTAAAPDDEFPFLKNASTLGLLRIHHAAIDELRRRKVVRTANAPLGDYAEYLFATAFGWSLEPNSASGHDATGPDGTRYQIKARRVCSGRRGERQLSVIRGLQEVKFEMLAAVLFDAQCDVLRAALIPHEVVLEQSLYVPHVNGWRLTFDDAIFAASGVEEVTGALRQVSASI